MTGPPAAGFTRPTEISSGTPRVSRTGSGRSQVVQLSCAHPIQLAGAAQAKTPSAFPRRAWSGSHDISAHAMPSNSGSIRYQTAAPSLCEHDGGRNSPISRVAARVSSTALKGRAEMTVASRQRSLAG